MKNLRACLRLTEKGRMAMAEEELEQYADMIWNAPGLIVKKYFKDDAGLPFECASYQAEVLKEIITRSKGKIAIRAATGAGKTEVVAIGSALRALFNPGEKIIIVSHTLEQSRNLFSKIKKHLVDDSIAIRRYVAEEKEFTRTTMNLRNGSWIRCFSSGLSDTGSESILGFHCNCLIIDESASIDNAIYYEKVLRMLGSATENSLLIELSTPHRSNHFKKIFADQSFLRYHWPWNLAVEQGRLSREFIEMQRRNMSDTQFTAWYQADFPSQSERGLFSLKEIEENIIEPKLEFEGDKILSCDIARYGNDRTVLTLLDRVQETFYVRQIRAFEKQNTMQTAGRIANLVKEFHFDSVVVDVVGLGGGVSDRLQEQDIYVEELNAGSKAEDDDRFGNLKAELYFKAKKLFEEGKLKIIREQRLIDDLVGIETDLTSDGKMRIVDPSKSPDFSDSLVYGLAARELGETDFPIY